MLTFRLLQWAVMYTIKKVPIEEIFFFMIQSAFAAQLFILLGLFDTPSQHLRYDTSTVPRKILRWSPLVLLAVSGAAGWKWAAPETHGFYLGCIAWWITPIISFLWFIAGDHFLSRWRTSIATMLLPTLYLCAVDTIALRAGTWHITERTSTGVFVIPDLPLEEATFFLATNFLLVCGMNAFDRSFAIIDVFGDLIAGDAAGDGGKTQSKLSSYEFVVFLVKSLLLRLDRLPASYAARIPAFEETQQVLAIHSRSFHTASYIFPSAVRRDLVILYAFCRVLDDFCDESPTKEEAARLIIMSKAYLDLLYPPSSATATALEAPFAPEPSHFAVSAFLHQQVPKEARSAFFLLSTICRRIPRYPFDDLIEGYEWDLEGGEKRPIVTTEDLVEYSRLVAASVAEMCVWAMWANEGDYGLIKTQEERLAVLKSAASMGIALQITNISRDIAEDATKGRIYIPSDWFRHAPSFSPSAAGGKEKSETLDKARMDDYANLSISVGRKLAPQASEFRYSVYLGDLLALAEQHKVGTSESIRKLPRSCQPGIRAATQVYIGIGQLIRKRAFRADGSANTDYDGTRVSLTKGQRVKIALREVYLKR